MGDPNPKCKRAHVSKLNCNVYLLGNVCMPAHTVCLSVCAFNKILHTHSMNACLLCLFACVSTYSSEAMEEFRDMDLGDRS